MCLAKIGLPGRMKAIQLSLLNLPARVIERSRDLLETSQIIPMAILRALDNFSRWIWGLFDGLIFVPRLCLNACPKSQFQKSQYAKSQYYYLISAH